MKNILRFVLLTGLALSFGSSASATQVAIDTEGYTWLKFVSADQQSGSGPGEFAITFGEGASGASQPFTVTYDSATGTARAYGSMKGVVTSADDWNKQINPATVSLNFDMTWKGLISGVDPVTGLQVLGIGRNGTEGVGEMSLSSSLFEGTTNFNIEEKFAYPNGGGQNDAVLGSYAAQPFSILVYGFLASAGDEVFNAWFQDAGQTILTGFHGRRYRLEQGDFRGTEIPEPATMGLLSFGLLGGALSKRRRARNGA